MLGQVESLTANEIMSKSEAARFARISERTLDRAIKSGALRVGRCGNRVLIRRSDLISAFFDGDGAPTVPSK